MPRDFTQGISWWSGLAALALTLALPKTPESVLDAAPSNHVHELRSALIPRMICASSQNEVLWRDL